jgi:uncharacterized membrane protein
MKRFLALLAGAFAVACSDSSGPSSTAPAQDIQFLSLPLAIDLTPDGSVALLEDFGTNLYFYHTATQELELKTRVGDSPGDFATAISGNRLITALYGSPVQAAFWSENAEWTTLASAYTQGCDDIAGSWDVSADGHVVVGLVWNKCNAEAFRWDATGSGVMTPLQRLGASFPGSPNPPANRATVVSDDGSMMAGWAQTSLVDRWPAVWRPDGTGFLLPGTALDVPGEVLSISDDGKMVAGTWGFEAFYWTEGTGVVNIGQLTGADPSDNQYPNAIAADGKLIFGGSGSPFFSVPRAWVWTQADGMRPLQDLIAENGVEIAEGYLLTNVIAAANDGSVVLGVAYDPNGLQVSFVLRLPISAYGL